MAGKHISEERLEQMYQFIIEAREKRGYAPSVRDIQERFGISSTSVVDYNLKKLEKRGLIYRTPRISRSIGVVEHGRSHLRNVITLPVVSNIAAGPPLALQEKLVVEEWGDSTETVEITEDMAGRYKPEELFVLRVKGNSMIEEMINDGDLVVIRYQQTAEQGQTIVAMLADKEAVTLKRYYREKDGRICLRPANPEIQPIYVNEENLHIQGRVIGVIRMM